MSEAKHRPENGRELQTWWRACPVCGSHVGWSRRGWRSQNQSARLVCSADCARARKSARQRARRASARLVVA